MLTLPIKKKWFDMILSGEKKEEYREIKPYWTKRLGFISDNKEETIYQVNKNILLRNGYSKNSPTLKCYVRIKKGYGKPEWGAEPNKEYYVLRILSVEEIENENDRNNL